MRNLKKNEKTFYALNYKGVEEVRDSEGNLTGEKTIQYSKLFTIKANLSGARGTSQAEVFGTDIHYDKSFTLTSVELERLHITENTVFFVNKKPTFKDNQPLYDYRVKKIAEAVNDVVIAIEKV